MIEVVLLIQTIESINVYLKCLSSKEGAEKNDQHNQEIVTPICIQFQVHVLFIFNQDQSEEKIINEVAVMSGIQPSGGPWYFSACIGGKGDFFSKSMEQLHMVEIKGAAGCMVLLYCQALLLIRKQDQRQY